MADLFNVQLISPEKTIFSGEVAQLMLPLFDGYSTIMANHAQMIAECAPGFVEIGGKGGQSYFILGGFAQIDQQGQLTVLAQTIVEKAALTHNLLDGYIEKAKLAMTALQKHRTQDTDQQLNMQEVYLHHLISIRDLNL